MAAPRGSVSSSQLPFPNGRIRASSASPSVWPSRPKKKKKKSPERGGSEASSPGLSLAGFAAYISSLQALAQSVVRNESDTLRKRQRPRSQSLPPGEGGGHCTAARLGCFNFNCFFSSLLNSFGADCICTLCQLAHASSHTRGGGSRRTMQRRDAKRLRYACVTFCARLCLVMMQYWSFLLKRLSGRAMGVLHVQLRYTHTGGRHGRRNISLPRVPGTYQISALCKMPYLE